VAFALPVLLLAGTAAGQALRIGVALEGQLVFFGLNGFLEYQQGPYGVQARIGWDPFGGLYLGAEGFWEMSGNARLALGLVVYPGVAPLEPDAGFTGVMLFPNAGERPKNFAGDLYWVNWLDWVHVGLGLPLQSAFYERNRSDWLLLALLRTRLQIALVSFSEE